MSPDPLQVISDEHALQLELCNILEAIADALPSNPDPHLVQISVELLTKGWPPHIEIEEKCLFPMLQRHANDNPVLRGILERLQFEHVGDEDLVDELVVALELYLEEGHVTRPNSLGYMLRGFFASQRRHIGWEEDVVLPMARELFSDEDLNRMQGWIMESDHPRCTQRSIIELKSYARGENICSDCPAQGKVVPNA
ncbi:MAG: hemerythrin domain-containing protein [Alphaproteobacteria bacterium]|nr:hemerythrin domain-containing protein [Alphaproteobacteria bacterium]